MEYLNLSVDNTLGGNNPSDTQVPSQKAIREFITKDRIEDGTIIEGKFSELPAFFESLEGKYCNGTVTYKITEDENINDELTITAYAKNIKNIIIDGNNNDTDRTIVLSETLYIKFEDDSHITFKNIAFEGNYSAHKIAGIRINVTSGMPYLLKKENQSEFASVTGVMGNIEFRTCHFLNLGNTFSIQAILTRLNLYQCEFTRNNNWNIFGTAEADYRPEICLYYVKGQFSQNIFVINGKNLHERTCYFLYGSETNHVAETMQISQLSSYSTYILFAGSSSTYIYFTNSSTGTTRTTYFSGTFDKGLATWS